MRPALLMLVVAACGAREAPPKAPVRVQRPVRVVDPPLTPQVALETIEKRYVGGMQRCYRARLKRDARAGGRVVVIFTVDDRGHVADPSAKGAGRQVERCVVNAMGRWTFPRPAAETTFRLAFRLSSRS